MIAMGVPDGGRRPTGGSPIAIRLRRCPMKEGKFTDAQKFEIALEVIAGKVPQAEVCRKWGISSTYAYKLKDRALAAMRTGVARPAGKPSAEVEGLRKKIADLEQLAGDQALVIRYLKKTESSGR